MPGRPTNPGAADPRGSALGQGLVAAARPRGRGSARAGAAWRRACRRTSGPAAGAAPTARRRCGPTAAWPRSSSGGSPRSAGGSGVVQSARSVRWPSAVSAASATRRCPSEVRWMRSSAHIRQSRRAAIPHRLSTKQPCRWAMVNRLAACTACRPRSGLEQPGVAGVGGRREEHVGAGVPQPHHGLLEPRGQPVEVDLGAEQVVAAARPSTPGRAAWSGRRRAAGRRRRRACGRARRGWRSRRAGARCSATASRWWASRSAQPT